MVEVLGLFTTGEIPLANILDLLEEVAAEVKKEDIQEAWDKYLLEHHLAGMTTKKMCHLFTAMHKMTWEEFDKLLRVPKYGKQHEGSPSRFIAAYLPVISKMLWDGVKHERILAYLKTHPVDTQMNMEDARKVSKEYKERTKADNKFKQAVLQDYQYKGHLAVMRKSNWSMTKKVR
jgi:hypothetical protein